MNNGSILDNDFMIKVCGYHLAEAAVELLIRKTGQLYAVSVAAYIVPKQMRKRKRIADQEAAASQFTVLTASLSFVEPTPEEVEVAAALEEQAQKEGLALDAGESLCVAILLSRRMTTFATGDKRAVNALEVIISGQGRGAGAIQVICLEQLILALTRNVGWPTLRERICAEPNIDTAIRLCFSCSAPSFDPYAAEAGLRSYIEDLRRSAPHTLAPDDLLLFAA